MSKYLTRYAFTEEDLQNEYNEGISLSSFCISIGLGAVALDVV